MGSNLRVQPTCLGIWLCRYSFKRQRFGLDSRKIQNISGMVDVYSYRFSTIIEIDHDSWRKLPRFHARSFDKMDVK